MRCGLKDCFARAEKPWTLGMAPSSVKSPTYSSTVYEKLVTQGHQIVSNGLMQLCCGDLDETVLQTNGLYAGGSSSGAVESLQSNQCDIAITTDTGGSTINPAGRAKLWGFKPTYGRISRWGLNPLCSWLDTVGLMARSLDPILVVFKELDQYDPKDPTSLTSSKRIETCGELTIASNFFNKSDLQGIRNLFPHALEQNFDLDLSLLQGAYFYWILPELYSNTLKFDGLHNKFPVDELCSAYRSVDCEQWRSRVFNQEVQTRIVLGRTILEKYSYSKLWQFRKFLEDKLDSKIWIFPIAYQTLQTNDCERYAPRACYLANLTRRPSITIPSETVQGFQLIGPRNSDYNLLKLAKTVM